MSAPRVPEEQTEQSASHDELRERPDALPSFVEAGRIVVEHGRRRRAARRRRLVQPPDTALVLAA